MKTQETKQQRRMLDQMMPRSDIPYYLFVFTGVLTDWTSGMVTVVAPGLSEAAQMAAQETDSPVSEFLQAPVSRYKLGECHRVGVKDYIYGGG